MIPTEILIAFGISSFFTVLFPLLLLVLLAIRRAISLRPLLIGVLAFFCFTDSTAYPAFKYSLHTGLVPYFCATTDAFVSHFTQCFRRAV